MESNETHRIRAVESNEHQYNHMESNETNGILWNPMKPIESWNPMKPINPMESNETNRILWNPMKPIESYGIQSNP